MEVSWFSLWQLHMPLDDMMSIHTGTTMGTFQLAVHTQVNCYMYVAHTYILTSVLSVCTQCFSAFHILVAAAESGM